MASFIAFARSGRESQEHELAVLAQPRRHDDDDVRHSEADDFDFDDNSPLLPTQSDPHDANPPFLRCPSLHSSVRSNLSRRKRIVFLVSLTVFTTFTAIVYFGFPSTLHLYLALLLITLPISFIIDLYSLGISHDWPSWTRSRTAWFALSALSVSFLSLQPLLLSSPLDATASVPPPNQTYYIASNLYNSASLLPHYSSALLSLISALGEENVFVSIYESNSKDRTKELLASLDRELGARGVRRRIKADNAGEGLRRDKGHWSSTLDRINYLARVRNEALEPLYEGVDGLEGGEFARVVWLNDVYFDWKSVLHLLHTHNGSYDLACAFDYIPLGFYDTWVTRDLCGDRVKPLWPYFAHADDVTLLARDEPIPVNSCWNGIAAYDARWFVPRSNTSTENSFQRFNSTPPSATDPAGNSTVDPSPTFPLRFRSEELCNSSECLLASYDMHRLSSPARPRIFMNPLVTATYDYPSHLLYTHILRWRIVAPWRAVWRDLISYRLFGRLTDVGRKRPQCKELFAPGWAEAPVGRVCPDG